MKEKIWKSVELRPLVVLMGLYAEQWEEHIPDQYMRVLPDMGSCHPQKTIEETRGICYSINHHTTPWILVTHHLEAIYTLNNCILAFELGDVKIPGITHPACRLDPKKVIAYACESKTEEPVCVSDPETGWISEVPLGKYGEQLVTEMNRIGTAVEEMKDGKKDWR